jgi:serine/threonine-protein kinase
MMKHLTETLPPQGVDSRLTPALHSVIARAMARSPEARFPTARDFAEALAVAAGQAPTATLAVAAPPRSKPLRDRIPRPSGRGLTGAAAAVGALFAAGVSLFWFLLAGSPQAPPPIAAPHNDGALEASAAGPLPPVAVPADAESLSPSPPLSSVPAEEARPSGGAFTRLPPGSLVVESNLPAVVTLNGDVLGAAPGTFHSISPGRHTLGLDAGEGRTFQKQLWITAGSTARIHHDFPDKVLPPERAESAPPVEASAAHAPLAPSTDLPEKTLSPRPESPVLWEGYLTDSNCRVRGAVDNHWRCLERCLREGARPMFYSKGRLYSLRGLERIAGDRNRTVAFEGWLDPKTNIISVVEPPN